MLEWVIFGIQLAVGVFFGISGFHKLFVKGRHETLVKTLKADHVPMLWFNQWAVPLTEFLGGLWLLTSVLPFFPATALLVITIGACIFDAPTRVKEMSPINLLDCLDCWLYLCETWLLLALLLVMAANMEDLEWIAQLL